MSNKQKYKDLIHGGNFMLTYNLAKGQDELDVFLNGLVDFKGGIKFRGYLVNKETSLMVSKRDFKISFVWMTSVDSYGYCERKAYMEIPKSHKLVNYVDQFIEIMEKL